MEFIETSRFSTVRERYLDDGDFHRLQMYLMDQPNAGDIIRGSGGIRKLRWGKQGLGKRGGIRVIYYWVTRGDQILLLTVYAKNEAKDLSQESIAQMRAIVKRL